MSFSSGTFSINSAGQPVVTGTVISSTAFNALTADLATGLSTCVLKDGTQTMTANLPMAGYVLTGLGAGASNGQSVRYEQVVGVYQLLSTYTTAGDIVQATGSGATARLAIGTARQQLAVNSGATALEYVASLQSLMTGTGDILQSSGANTPARLAIGTARQVPTVNAGATALAYANPITITAEQASTSGTSIDFTSIPSGVRRITVMFKGVSTNGTSNIIIQLGVSGTPETSGYLSSSSGLSTVVSTGTHTTGFGIANNNSGFVLHGAVIISLERSSTNSWASNGVIADHVTPVTWTTAGDKSLAGVLDSVRITMVNGTDAFDAGAIAISYE